MTFLAFALRSPSPAAAVGGYRPGVCNIGPEEIARRRRAGHVALIAAVIVLGALVAFHAPPIARLVLVLPAAGAAVGYLQAWVRFCAGFGSRGLYNFGPLGGEREVGDDESRARDRARSMQIFAASLAIGIVVAVVAVLLPL